MNMGDILIRFSTLFHCKMFLKKNIKRLHVKYSLELLNFNNLLDYLAT